MEEKKGMYLWKRSLWESYKGYGSQGEWRTICFRSDLVRRKKMFFFFLACDLKLFDETFGSYSRLSMVKLSLRQLLLRSRKVFNVKKVKHPTHRLKKDHRLPTSSLIDVLEIEESKVLSILQQAAKTLDCFKNEGILLLHHLHRILYRQQNH